jgi:hypothetical protein
LVGSCVDCETGNNFEVGGRGAVEFAGGVQGSQEEARVEKDFRPNGQGGPADGKRSFVEDELSEAGEGGCGGDVEENTASTRYYQENLGEGGYLGVCGGLGLRGPQKGFGKVVETEGLVALVEVVERGGRGRGLETEGLRNKVEGATAEIGGALEDNFARVVVVDAKTAPRVVRLGDLELAETVLTSPGWGVVRMGVGGKDVCVPKKSVQQERIGANKAFGGGGAEAGTVPLHTSAGWRSGRGKRRADGGPGRGRK